ncbi:MAG: class I SAM-dependent methyltransferase [Flavobacteriales bacterium]|nr:class I SAM-dependent methyltransferase [Flavobacteriales bacterium]
MQGTEFGERSIKACQAKGIPVKEGVLNPTDFAPESFDVVCTFEVVEHLVDPSDEIDKMLTLLRPGGLLYVTVPNFNCIARHADPGNWNVASYPEHLNYFTPRTMNALLTAKGLRRSWLATTGISIERWKTKRTTGKQGRKQAHLVQEKLRGKLEASWYLRFAKASANGILTTFAIGDSLKAAYVKPATP